MKMKHQIDFERVKRIRSELAFDDYVPGAYEVASAYIQQMDDCAKRLELVMELSASCQAGASALKRLQTATGKLAEAIFSEEHSDSPLTPGGGA